LGVAAIIGIYVVMKEQFERIKEKQKQIGRGK
jgi:hypothetical protein